eukprot:Skav203956  [mRNA]  locus=scaffold391:472720:477201:+ [translate_table: standard]
MHCIVGAAVYAPPSGPTYKDSKKLTSDLLGTLTEELVCGRQGPRFIAGDMNCDIHDLSVFRVWEAAGWMEAQAWEHRFHHVPRKPTCKGVTIRDHVWLSPELQQWLTHVQVLDSFADHSVVSAGFVVPRLRFWQYVWPQPSVFPWSHVDSSQMDFVSQEPFTWNQGTSSVDFADWSRLAETELVAQASKQTFVPPSVRGRGQTVRVTKRPAQLLPIKASRHGDSCPRSQLLGRKVHQWCRQLRRIQAFAQRAAVECPSPHLQHDQCCTWSAILRASGFGKSFRDWWPFRKVKLHGSPTVFPTLPPSHACARILYLDMEANYRDFERWHLCRRTEVIKAKHQDHNRILFKQLRGDSCGALTHLRSVHSFTVAVVLSPYEVELDSPVPPLQGSVSWSLEGFDAQVQVHDHRDIISIHTDLLLAVGQSLDLSMTLTEFQAVEAELHALWDPIWNRHAGLADQHWDRVVAFGLHSLPSGHTPSVSWTAPHLRGVIDGYKKKASRGPDSWGRLDLAALTDLRLSDLTSMFDHLEAGTFGWPRQLVTGFVNPLPKVPGAEAPVQFRPIVLISLLYRLWASASSKNVLPAFTRNISPRIFGYVPGRRASEIWSLLQLSLEMAMCSDQALTGFCADLVRCFNRLPRLPLFRLLAHLGVPSPTLVAWKAALASLERRFRVLADVGEARGSCTGFPEGDPLSCLAMLAFNVVFDQYVQVYSPSCVPLSFVDNLQLLAASAATLQHGIIVVEEFLSAWDVDIDQAKSYAWSSCGRQRSILRSLGLGVKLHAKDLGAQLAYCAKPCKKVFQQRLDAVGHVWRLLRHSSAAPWFRKQAILVAVWPKLLHACEASWVTEAECAKLRSRCMFALGWNRAGASPAVRWSLMQNPMLDPLFFQVWNVISNFWRLSKTYPLVRESWIPFFSSGHLSNQGVFHAFEMALQILDWLLDDTWTLHVRDLFLNWHQVSLDTLRQLAIFCWRQRVGRERSDFEGLQSIDVNVSFGSYKATTIAESELVATIQDGTFYLNKHLSKFDASKQATCANCGEEDTLEHRCLRCPKYAAVRNEHVEAIQQWDSSPYFAQHALVEMNPFQWTHWKLLQALPDTRQDFFAGPHHDGLHHIFTDGSCKFPASPWKLAAWGVILMDSNRVLAQGVVPGLVQTSDLAELFAAHSALCWALHYGARICLHTDSQYVISGLDHLRRVGHVPGSWKYVHIWWQVLEVLHLLGDHMWDTHHVFSHQNCSSAANALQEWFIRGNANADSVPAQAQLLRPPDFEDNYQRLLAHDRCSRLKVRRQLQLLVAIAQTDLRNGVGMTEWDPEDTMISELGISCTENGQLLAQQVDSDFVQHIPRHLSGGFSFHFRQQLLRFVISCDMQAATSRFVSGLELLAAFMLSGDVSIPIPRKVGADIIYEDPVDVIGGGLIRVTFAGALSTLKKALFTVFNDSHVQCEWGRASRVDVGLLTSVWAIRIGWGDLLDGAVVSKLHSWASGRPWRYAYDFARPF